MPFPTWPNTVASDAVCRSGSVTGITTDMRRSRWSKNGVLDRVFASLQRARRIWIKAMGFDNTHIKVHSDDTGARKKRHPMPRLVVEQREPPVSSGVREGPNCGGLPALPRPCARDAPEGRKLWKQMENHRIVPLCSWIVSTKTRKPENWCPVSVFSPWCRPRATASPADRGGTPPVTRARTPFWIRPPRIAPRLTSA